MRFHNRGNYKNFQCHYAPIVQYEGMDYRPPKLGINDITLKNIGQSHQYDELVIFNEEHVFPQFIVTLKATVSKALEVLLSKSILVDVAQIRYEKVEAWTVDDVCKWMGSLKLSKDYSEVIRSQHINGEVLRTLKTSEDWKEAGITTFGDLRILVIQVSSLK